MGVNERGVLGDILHYNEMLSALKTVNKKLMTNTLISKQILEKLIINEKVYYSYGKNSFLNLFIEKEGYFELLYWIADLSDYEIEFECDAVVCSVVFRDRNVQAVKQIGAVLNNGFQIYSAFKNWRCTNLPKLQDMKSEYHFVSEGIEDAMPYLYKMFDPYSDMLPEKNEIDKFCQEKSFCGIYDDSAGKLIAGSIYSQKGSVSTHDYCFVDPQYRGTGLVWQIFEYYHVQQKDNCSVFEAWIRNDNLASIKIHERLNYKRGILNKVVLMRN